MHAVSQDITLFVVVGEKDEVVDTEAALRMFQLQCIKNYAGASYHLVPGAGHIALMTTCARESSKNFVGNLKEEAKGVKRSVKGRGCN